MWLFVLFCFLWDFSGPFSEAALSSQSLWGAQCPLLFGGDPLKPAGPGRHVQRGHSKTEVLRRQELVRSMALSKDES